MSRQTKTEDKKSNTFLCEDCGFLDVLNTSSESLDSVRKKCTIRGKLYCSVCIEKRIK